MKKFLIAAFIAATALNAYAQSAKDVFSSKEIVWYGLDFSKASFVGQFDQGFGAMPATGSDIKNKWVTQWNNLVGTEPQNFKLKEALHKESIYYDLAPVAAINAKMNAEKCIGMNAASIDPKEIDGMVKEYGSGDKKQGVGLVFIVENFNKTTEMADVYVTFFDVATKKVYFTEKMHGKAAGVGLRNYWAGAIKQIIKQINNSYSGWKSQYGK